MLSTADLLDQLALAHGVGVEQGAPRNRHMQLGAVLGERKPRDRLLAITRVDEIVLYLALAHDGEILWDGNDVHFAATLGVLVDQSQLSVCGNMPTDLALFLRGLEWLDLILCNDLVSSEALGEMENFD